jgi:CHAT domain-containing protein
MNVHLSIKISSSPCFRIEGPIVTHLLLKTLTGRRYPHGKLEMNLGRHLRIYAACRLLAACSLALTIFFPLSISAAQYLVDITERVGRGRDMLVEGKCQDAGPFFAALVDALEQEHGSNDASILPVLFLQAQSLEQCGNLAAARDTLDRTLQLSKILGYPDSQDPLPVLENLAAVCAGLGDHFRAVTLYETLRGAAQRLHGKHSPMHIRALTGIGLTKIKLGLPEEAESSFRMALSLVDNTAGAGPLDALDAHLGLAASRIEAGRYAEAAEMLLALSPPAGQTHRELRAFLRLRSYLASAYIHLGRYVEAQNLLETSIQNVATSESGDSALLLPPRQQLAYALEQRGDFGRSAQVFSNALQTCLRLYGSDNPTTLELSDHLAGIYTLLGDYMRAAALAELTLNARKGILSPEHPDIAVSLNTLARIYLADGKTDKALELFEQAHALLLRLRGPGHPDSLASLGESAEAYCIKGNYQRALSLGEQVYEGFSGILGKEHPDTIRALRNFGMITYRAQDYRQAQIRLRTAQEACERTLGPFHPDCALNADYLSRALEKSGELVEAVFYARVSVEAAQRQRRAQRSLEERLQKSFLAAVDDRYQHLGALLIKTGHPEEAQQVLRMLKDEELSAMIGSASPSQSETAKSDMPLHEYARKGEAVAALAREQRVLQDKRRKEGLSEEEKERLTFLGKEITAANTAFQEFMRRLPSLLQGADSAAHLDAARLVNLESLRAMLRGLGQGCVLIHTLSAEDTLYIFLTTPDVLLVRSSPIGSEELGRQVEILYRLLRNPSKDPRRAAEKIYDVLVGPIADELRGAGAQTLMFSLDGSLRYIPMAALHDGERWLVESYAVTLFNEASRANMHYSPMYEADAVGMGVTKSLAGFDPLPSVKEEIEGIIRSEKSEAGILPGTGLLDGAFTRDSLADSLRTPVIHIASHFQFSPAAPDQSFLLLGDGNRLFMSDLNVGSDFNFEDVDQLTLSACDTASSVGKGDGREVEGFGALAQHRGARSVSATLWPVDDSSTGRLMREFYRLRFLEKENKAQALRQAQVNLMQNKSAPEKQGIMTRGTSLFLGNGELEAVAAWSGSGYSHPYYWAPFVLMGNWK